MQLKVSQGYNIINNCVTERSKKDFTLEQIAELSQIKILLNLLLFSKNKRIFSF